MSDKMRIRAPQFGIHGNELAQELTIEERVSQLEVNMHRLDQLLWNPTMTTDPRPPLESVRPQPFIGIHKDAFEHTPWPTFEVVGCAPATDEAAVRICQDFFELLGVQFTPRVAEPLPLIRHYLRTFAEATHLLTARLRGDRMEHSVAYIRAHTLHDGLHALIDSDLSDLPRLLRRQADAL